MLVQTGEFGVQGEVACDTMWKKTKLTPCPLLKSCSGALNFCTMMGDRIRLGDLTIVWESLVVLNRELQRGWTIHKGHNMLWNWKKYHSSCPLIEVKDHLLFFGESKGEHKTEGERGCRGQTQRKTSSCSMFTAQTLRVREDLTAISHIYLQRNDSEKSNYVLVLFLIGKLGNIQT